MIVGGFSWFALFKFFSHCKPERYIFHFSIFLVRNVKLSSLLGGFKQAINSMAEYSKKSSTTIDHRKLLSRYGFLFAQSSYNNVRKSVMIIKQFVSDAVWWPGLGIEWKTIFPYSILAIFFRSMLKIFHSILKFSSIFHFILPYQGKFRPKTICCWYCTFATLSIPLQAVACEGKQYGLMHLISYLKFYHNELP